MRVKLVLGMVIVIELITLTGCSSPAVYNEPSYYQYQMVPKQYQAGKTYFVDDLRCLSTNENCTTDIKSREDHHRKYPKPYLFY